MRVAVHHRPISRRYLNYSRRRNHRSKNYRPNRNAFWCAATSKLHLNIFTCYCKNRGSVRSFHAA